MSGISQPVNSGLRGLFVQLFINPVKFFLHILE